MTLTVSAYRVDRSGTQHEISLASNLAGLEVSRASFYGSDWAKDLGLVLLPQLEDTGVLTVIGVSLGALQAEVSVLVAALKGTDNEAYWLPRLANIAAAIEAVSSLGEQGCVVIA